MTASIPRRVLSTLCNQLRHYFFERELARLKTESKISGCRVAFNLKPVHGPWGGGNQWLHQISRFLAKSGFDVCFELTPGVDLAVLVDPRPDSGVTFTPEQIKRYRVSHPELRCVHRINECDQRKGTKGVDEVLAAANQVADHTVFVSEWLAQYHQQRWFSKNRSFSVIEPGADPGVFHARGHRPLEANQTMRLVTHHWSDNWSKGFATYQAIDNLIANGEIKNAELWIIGRWPAEIKWRAARTFPAIQGPRLAELLRQCHVYVTASKWEPGSMHHLEGIQCGLPILFDPDGGGIVETARRYGFELTPDIPSAIENMRRMYTSYYAQVLASPPSGNRMCAQYVAILSNLRSTREILDPVSGLAG